MILNKSELHHSIGSLIDGAHPGPKTDGDYLGRYCPKTFETAKENKEKYTTTTTTKTKLLFLSLCRFKGLRTVTAQIISISLRIWVSPIYQASYAVMKLRFVRNLYHIYPSL